ncbi:MAG: nucleotide sugar dehydrogenase [Epsilonproteobacteria bacterium]|nr:nucleotide sugar dehydrogenase [Campylobacterota bacterium]
MKRISIVGLGYIGLPTAIMVAQAGFEVLGFDIDRDKVNHINEGIPTIFEPEVAERLLNTLQKKSFKAFHDLQYADCFVIAVPTPFKDNKQADLSYVFQAAEMVGKRLMPGNLIILESTVPVGTTERLAAYLEEISGLKLGINFFVAYCPERVLPSNIFKEVVGNDRVIGGMCQRSCELAQSFYEKFVKGFLHVTDDKTAEMVKLVENSSRDVQIAFANQVDAMCRQAGIDPYYVIELANKHPRVNILSPTCGVGGHCIAVDPWFLIETFPQQTELLRLARTLNAQKPVSIIEKTLREVKKLRSLGSEKVRVLTLGLTFKPDVDDVRESPALQITQALNLHKDSISLQTYDPLLSKDYTTKLGFSAATDLFSAVEWADIVIILVKHKSFLLMPKNIFDDKIVIDTCGLMHALISKQTQKSHEAESEASFKSATSSM